MPITSTWPAINKGPGALKPAAADWRDFAVITTASPWALAAPHMPTPGAVTFVTDLNRPTLEAFLQYAFEQGVTPRRLQVEELFAPETRESFKI